MVTDYMVIVYLGIMGYREKYHRIMARGFSGQRTQATRQPTAILYFEDLESAEQARLELLEMGFSVGVYVMKCRYQEGKYIGTAVVTPACGWQNVDKEDLEISKGAGVHGVRVRFTTDRAQLKSGGDGEQKSQEKSRKKTGKNQRADGSGTEGTGDAACRARKKEPATDADGAGMKEPAEDAGRAARENRAAADAADGAQLTMADEMGLS